MLLDGLALAGFLLLRRGRLAFLAGLLLPAAFFLWIRTDYVSTNPRPLREDAWTVVLWNIARPAQTETAFVPSLLAADADIVVLVESGVDESLPMEFWQSNFPGYHTAVMEWGITVLSRFPIKAVQSRKLLPGAHAGVCELDTPAGPIVVIPVDLDSNPIRSRRPGFEKLFRLASEQSNPLILAGDFNTPHTSVFFGEFRHSFRHAFEETGNGWITTWPGYAPILALDHIWLSPKLVPIRTEHRRNIYSDHAMVVTQIAPLQ
ncbi:MAG: endonuclease/exonuclease/phosphatase family protein [Sedimentisphaerales bacterium]|nr:endonuclease/exonuclease/phosphatase family protein [Sedimentisphaerales bacterium]